MSHRLTLCGWLLMAGCLPVELDVSPSGQLIVSREEGWFVVEPADQSVKLVRSVEADLPVFARFSPDGRSLLTIAEVDAGVGRFDLRIGPPDGGPGRLLLRTRNPTYVEFAPDGSQLALTRLSTEALDPGKDEESLELVLVDPSNSAVRVLTRPVGPLVRWLPDSRELLALRIVRRTDQQHLLADLVRVDRGTATCQPVARVLCGEGGHLDVSRDGRHAAVCGFDAGPPESEFQVTDFPKQRLILIDLETGAIDRTDQTAAYALYSPDGRQLLVATVPTDGTLSRNGRLLVADPDGRNARQIADQVHVAAAMGGETPVFAGWIDPRRIYYFTTRLTYGRAGRALTLMTVDHDGRHRRCLQPAIDQAAQFVTTDE